MWGKLKELTIIGDFMNEFNIFKEMAYTALNVDIEKAKDHKAFHRNDWQHPNCVWCQKDIK